jgi:hypothetical protein
MQSFGTVLRPIYGQGRFFERTAGLREVICRTGEKDRIRKAIVNNASQKKGGMDD